MYKTPENFKIGRYSSEGGVLKVADLKPAEKAKLERALKLGIIQKMEDQEKQTRTRASKTE